jgi:hypothetical protein
LTNINVEEHNLKLWKRQLKLKSNSIPVFFFKKYGLNNLDEYIYTIETNINNEPILIELKKLFELNTKIKIENDKITDKERIKKLLLESSKKTNDNVKIRMLRESDEKKAKELYINFKISFII